jgi:hypothetical protein
MNDNVYRPTRSRMKSNTTAEDRMNAEVAEYEKNSGRTLDAPDLNEIVLHTPLGDPSNVPTDARGKMSHRERQEFIANNPDQPTTAETMKAARIQKRNDHWSVKWQNWFRETVKANKSLQVEWQRLGQTGNCPFLQHIYQGDPAETRDHPKTLSSIRIFADSETFVPWRELDRSNKERFDLMLQILDFVNVFLDTNFLDATRDDSWGISFNLLNSAGLIPKPLPPVAKPVEKYDPVNEHVIKRQKYMTEIVGNDELGHDFTEEMLDKLPAKEALRLRRLFEKGHRGDNRMDLFFEMRSDEDRIRQKLFGDVLAQ